MVVRIEPLLDMGWLVEGKKGLNFEDSKWQIVNSSSPHPSPLRGEGVWRVTASLDQRHSGLIRFPLLFDREEWQRHQTELSHLQAFSLSGN